MEETAATTKICRRCGEEKAIDEFYRNKGFKDGHMAICIKCRKELIKNPVDEPKITEMKTTFTCTRCNIDKPIELFHKRKRNKNGHNSFCKKCAIEDSKKFRIKNENRRTDKQSKRNGLPTKS